jgi:pyrroline-5-carboxylate reductase
MKKKSIGFIGGGRISKIMLHGFTNKHVEFDSITVCDTNEDVLTDLKAAFPNILITHNAVEAATKEIVIVALHPPAIIETLKNVKSNLDKNAIVISLAPKITIEKLAMSTGLKNIARTIPNASSFINKGYNPLCFSDEFPEADKLVVLDMLRALGYTFETDERKLESYAIISAMLPTYFWFQWQELEKIGLKIGLNEGETKEAIRETLLAATQLFYNPDLSHEEVMDLIPIKPVAEHEQDIRDCFNSKLLSLFEKIKPEAMPA